MYSENSRLIYDDGREGHRVGATVLSRNGATITVQFDDRADTTTISLSDRAWMDYISPAIDEPLPYFPELLPPATIVSIVVNGAPRSVAVPVALRSGATRAQRVSALPETTRRRVADLAARQAARAER